MKNYKKISKNNNVSFKLISNNQKVENNKIRIKSLSPKIKNGNTNNNNIDLNNNYKKIIRHTASGNNIINKNEKMKTLLFNNVDKCIHNNKNKDSKNKDINVNKNKKSQI